MAFELPPPPSGFRRFLPGLTSIESGGRGAVTGDIRAALTVGAVVVPQSLAYATLAGMPSVHGLYTALAAMVAYALFGTSRDLNMGAESTVAIMVAAAVAPIATNPDDAVAVTALAALLVGGYCVLGFVFRLGFISDFLSRPILAGYVFGSGIIILISQLEPLLGLDVDEDLYITDIGAVVRNLDETHWLTAAVGAGTIVLVFGLRRLVPVVPAPLVAVIVGIALSAAFDLDQEGLAVVGDIKSGIPRPGLPGASFEQLTRLMLPTLGIALLAYPDSFLTARSLAARSDDEVDANQEFLALGASNVAAGFLQGFPVNGSQSRSFVQQDAGARTSATGLMCAALVGLTLLFLTPVFEQLPLAVLAGIVIVAGIGLLGIEDFRQLWHIRRIEFWLGLATIASVLGLGMLGGIAAAVLLSLLVVLGRSLRPHTAELGKIVGDNYGDVDVHEQAETIPGLFIYRFDAELFFANTRWFVDDLEQRLAAADPPASEVLFVAEVISDLDTTAVEAIEQVLDDLESAGVGFSVARVRAQVRETFDRSGLTGRIGEDRFFPDVSEGVLAFQARAAARADEPPTTEGDHDGS